MDVLSRFDLNLLVIFDAIYSEGGVSRAADRLCLTQSAVSHALRRLRELLQDPLFSREGNVMIPNRTADQLITPVRLALETVKASLDNLYAFDPATSEKHFRIGVRGPAESITVPPIFNALRQAAPHATLGILYHDKSSMEGFLKSRAVDLTIEVVQPGYENLEYERLGKVDFVVLLRPGHPALSSKLNLARYMQLTHIVASTRRSGLGFEDAVLRGRIRGRKVVLQCQSYAAAAAATAATDAVLTAPRNIAEEIRTQTPLVAISLFPEVMVEYAMYWSRENMLDPGAIWLRDLVRQCAHRSLHVNPQGATVTPLKASTNRPIAQVASRNQ